MKGLKSAYKLKEKLNTAPNLPVEASTNLFKTCVSSCMMYGCEIWGVKNVTTLETVQASFAKYILKVGNKVPNAGALAELGLLPLTKVIMYRVLKYWLRIITEKPVLLWKAYTNLLSIDEEPWCKFVKKSLDNLGLSEVWKSQGVESPEPFLSLLRQRIQDIHTQEFRGTTSISPRLNVLHMIDESPNAVSEQSTYANT